MYLFQARKACEAWKQEATILNKKSEVALKEKESALGKALHLQRELEVMGGGPYLHAVKRVSELKTLPVNILKALEHQLKKDLDEIDKVKARVLSSWNILYPWYTTLIAK